MITKNFLRNITLAFSILIAKCALAGFYSPSVKNSIEPEKFTISLPSDINGNIYSSAIDPKFAISNSNRAQNVILLNKQTLYIDNDVFYAQVTSEVQHTNKVIFIKEDASSFNLGYDQKYLANYINSPSSTYPSYSSNADLGHQLNYLKSVQFSSNASVSGNVTADQIIIDTGKTAFITAGTPNYSQPLIHIGSRIGEVNIYYGG